MTTESVVGVFKSVIDQVFSISGTSADREIQRTLMELLNQLDGFEALNTVKIVMATNRPDILDPALLRPGRIDRKVLIPLPNDAARLDILKIHSQPVQKMGDIDYEAVVKLTGSNPISDLHCFFRWYGEQLC